MPVRTCYGPHPVTRTKVRTDPCALRVVGFDRATLPWHAGQLLRGGHDHRGLILFRRTVRGTDYGQQARLLTGFWAQEGSTWDWLNRTVYLPKSP